MKKSFLYIFFVFLSVLYAGCAKQSSFNRSSFEESWSYKVTLERDGEAYDEFAFPGQVCLLFNESVTYKQCEQIIRSNGGWIMEYDAEIGYYLVGIPEGKESAFVSQVSGSRSVYYAYPNTVSFEKYVTPYVIDNFTGSHGDRVVQMLSEASSLSVRTIDATAGNSECFVSADKKFRAIRSSIGEASRYNSVVINLSCGIGLGSKNANLWNEQGITTREKRSYVHRYISDLVGLVKFARRNYDYWTGRDFIIVKAAGNEGMKQMEEVFWGVRKELSKKEYRFFKEHFILVSAKDDHVGKSEDYPNDISGGGYDDMISKVDISDKTAHSSRWHGTSFSSPRLAGYIAKAADRYNMDVAEVLEYVRRATLKAPGHVLTYELLQKEITGESAGDMAKKQSHDATTATYLGESSDAVGTTYTYQIACDPSWFNSGNVYNIELPNGEKIRYAYRYDNEYVGMNHTRMVDTGNGYYSYMSETYCNREYVDPWFDKVDYILDEPMHYIAFWDKREEEGVSGAGLVYYMITAKSCFGDDQESWTAKSNYPRAGITHQDVVYDIMGLYNTTIKVSFFTNRY